MAMATSATQVHLESYLTPQTFSYVMFDCTPARASVFMVTDLRNTTMFIILSTGTDACCNVLFMESPISYALYSNNVTLFQPSMPYDYNDNICWCIGIINNTTESHHQTLTGELMCDTLSKPASNDVKIVGFIIAMSVMAIVGFAIIIYCCCKYKQHEAFATTSVQ